MVRCSMCQSRNFLKAHGEEQGEASCSPSTQRRPHWSRHLHCSFYRTPRLTKWTFLNKSLRRARAGADSSWRIAVHGEDPHWSIGKVWGGRSGREDLFWTDCTPPMNKRKLSPIDCRGKEFKHMMTAAKCSTCLFLNPQVVFFFLFSSPCAVKEEEWGSSLVWKLTTINPAYSYPSGMTTSVFPPFPCEYACLISCWVGKCM